MKIRQSGTIGIAFLFVLSILLFMIGCSSSGKTEVPSANRGYYTTSSSSISYMSVQAKTATLNYVKFDYGNYSGVKTGSATLQSRSDYSNRVRLIYKCGSTAIAADAYTGSVSVVGGWIYTK
jgi:hypothetical protein